MDYGSEPRQKYSDKLKDPRWQKMRLKVLERDDWCCQNCFDSENTLHVHHRYYEQGNDPWDYPLEALVTLCATCHAEESESRPGAERTLLQALRKAGLDATDIEHLAATFEVFEPTHLPGVVIDAICLAIRRRKAQRKLVNDMFEYLHALDQACLMGPVMQPPFSPLPEIESGEASVN